MQDLNGQRILVVGGSRGIGAATVRAAAGLGADVTIASRSPARPGEASGPDSRAIKWLELDATRCDSVRDVIGGSGRWDHVVVTAGGFGSAGHIADTPIDAARASFDAKFWATFHVAAAARIAPGGSLTLLSGLLAWRPAAGRALNSAINAALEGLARGLALELAPVRVNSICPGLTRTSMFEVIPEDERDRLFAATASRVPAGRVTEAEDVAAAILMCIRNPAVTGINIVVDGGALIS
jgi:NAD(P)-dependent dehydrogenase (short-subunit alcohol dehydrogenase family)